MSVRLALDLCRGSSASVLSSNKAATGCPASAPVYLIAMHGFLAHSGGLQTFIRALSAQIDVAISQGAQPTDIRMVCPDARNHGSSPHTSTHEQSSLVQDLHAFLHAPPDSGYGIQSLAQATAATTTTASEKERIRVIALGHSMGSSTWARYLMEHKAIECMPAEGGQTPSRPVDVVGFVSLDMPPITAAQWSPELHTELANVVAAMETVELANITDYRSAHEEFLRCGMTDVRTRGLCSTNLLLPPPPGSAAARVPGAVTQTRWKCNLNVLKTALNKRTLFFPDNYFADRVAQGACIKVPVRVLSILGGNSPVGADPAVRGLWAKYAVDAEEHFIDGATHTVYFDRPKETSVLTVEFLRRLGVL